MTTPSGRAGISAVPSQRTPYDAPGNDLDHERRRTEHLLRHNLAAAEHRLGEVVRRTAVLVVGISGEGVVTSAQGCALADLAPGGVAGARVAALPAEFAALLAPYELALGGHETALVCEAAGRFWDVSYVPADGGVLVVARDITEHRELVRQLESYGDVDPLTGLLNRPGLQAKMDALIIEAERAGHRVALLYADVDDFKDVNESLGHGVGDELLVGLSTRVTAALPGAALLARHGGDAFLAVLAGPDLDEAAVQRHGEALLRHLSTPLTVGEVDLDLTASIGVSLYPDDASTT